MRVSRRRLMTRDFTPRPACIRESTISRFRRVGSSPRRNSCEAAVPFKKEPSHLLVQTYCDETPRETREIIALLDSHGISVSMVKTDRPGYVVYEDDDQMV